MKKGKTLEKRCKKCILHFSFFASILISSRFLKIIVFKIATLIIESSIDQNSTHTQEKC